MRYVWHERSVMFRVILLALLPALYCAWQGLWGVSLGEIGLAFGLIVLLEFWSARQGKGGDDAHPVSPHSR
jgi:hypothetical protein